uniref:Putative replicase n=1 Tax=Stamford virus TaxID=2600335 RepID=A0A5B8XEF5_9PICO|nr:putative replicase [Stamford virus]
MASWLGIENYVTWLEEALHDIAEGLTMGAGVILLILAGVLLFGLVKVLLNYFSKDGDWQARDYDVARHRMKQQKRVRLHRGEAHRLRMHRRPKSAKHQIDGAEEDDLDLDACFVCKFLREKEVTHASDYSFYVRQSERDDITEPEYTYVTLWDPDHPQVSVLNSWDEFSNLLERVKNFKSDYPIYDKMYFEAGQGDFAPLNGKHNEAFIWSCEENLETRPFKATAFKERVSVTEDFTLHGVSCEIEFTGLDENEEELQAFWKRLNKFCEKFDVDSYYMSFTIDGDKWKGRLMLLSAKDEGKTTLFTRQWLKLKQNDIRYINGDIEDIPDVAFNPVEETRHQQSDDPQATAILEKLLRHNKVIIARGYDIRRVTQSASGFDTQTLASCTGLANQDGVFIPAHVGALGTIIKVGLIGSKTYDEAFSQLSEEYYAAKIINTVEKRDVAYAVFLSKSECKAELSKLAGKTVHVPRMKVAPRFACIKDYLNSSDDLAKLIDKITVLRHLPKSNITTLGKASARYYKNFKTSKGTHEFIGMEIVGAYMDCSPDENISQDGDCGGPVVLFSKTQNKKLIGFHSAGNRNTAYAALLDIELYESLVTEQISYQMDECSIVRTTTSAIEPAAGLGHQQFEDWPVIEWSEHDPFKQMIVKGSCPDAPDGAHAIKVGMMFKTHTAANQNKAFAGFYKSPFFGCFELRMTCAPLDPKDSRIKATLPENKDGKPSLLLRANELFASPRPALDKTVAERVFYELYSFEKIVLKGYRLGMTPGMSVADIIDEGINGHPGNSFVRGIETKTSAGLPWAFYDGCMLKSDFIEVDPYTGRRSIRDNNQARKLVQIISHNLKESNDCRRTISFTSSKLKKCLVSLKNVELGKTRIFNVTPIEDVILSNALFGRYKDAFYSERVSFHHAVGINVHSLEWDALYTDLTMHEFFIDIDFKNFDRTLHELFCRQSYRSIINIIQDLDPDQYANARYVLAEKDVTGLIVDNSTVFQKLHGNTSGHPNTTVTNCKVNIYHVVYAWHMITGLGYAEFLTYVKAYVYGDDIVMSVAREFIHLYNFNSIKRVFDDMGLSITPGNKGEPPYADHTPLSELSFLKRKFVQLDGMTVAPLDQKSIEKAFGYTEIEHTDQESYRQLIDDHMDEALLHGQEYFKMFRKRLLARMENPRFPTALGRVLAPILSTTYSQRLESYKIRYYRQTADATGMARYLQAHQTTVFQAFDDLNLFDLPQVQDHPERLLRLEEKVKHFEDIIPSALESLGKVEKKVVDVERQLKDLVLDYSKYDARLEALDLKISETIEDVQLHGQAIDNHTAKLTTMEADLDTFKEDVMTFEENLEVTLKAHAEKITELDEDISKTSRDLRYAHERIDVLFNNYDKLDVKFNALDTELEETIEAMMKNNATTARWCVELTDRLTRDWFKFDHIGLMWKDVVLCYPKAAYEEGKIRITGKEKFPAEKVQFADDISFVRVVPDSDLEAGAHLLRTHHSYPEPPKYVEHQQNNAHVSRSAVPFTRDARSTSWSRRLPPRRNSV